MNNNMYNILNKLNALNEVKAPVKKPKVRLQENMEQVLSEKYQGFKKTVAAIKKGGSAENPEAVAAAIGRKKYGKEKFQKAAAKGKKLGENTNLQSIADKDIERDLPPGDGTGGYVDDTGTDLQTIADKDIEYNLPAGDGTGGYVKDKDMDESALQAYLGKKKYGQQGMKALQKAGRDGASKEKMAQLRAKHDKMDEQQRVSEAKSDDPDYDEDLKRFKKGLSPKKKKGVAEASEPKLGTVKANLMNTKEPTVQVRVFKNNTLRGDSYWVNKEVKKFKTKDQAQAYVDRINKKDVKEGKKPDYIDLDKDGNKKEPMKKAANDAKKQVQEKAVSKAQQKFMGMVYSAKKGEKPASKEVAKTAKGMSKKSAKDYASTKHKGLPQHVKEAVQQLFSQGWTTEQIVESWEDMLKAVEKQRKDKGTGKFDKKQISTGTVYTRKYDPKTGETDDSENVTAVKRGRGRPKKSTFESSISARKMISESFTGFFEGSIQGGVWTSNPPKKGQPNVPPPQDIDGGSVAPSKPAPTKAAPTNTQKTEPMGTIRGGVWTSTPPKPGEKGVPAPSALPEGDMEEGNAFSGAVAKAKADGVQPGETIKVGGKTYPVKEGEELMQMLRIAGIKVMEDAEQLEECGMSAMGNGMMGAEQEGKMNVTTSMSSDGNKNVTITADGNAAAELMQMLKLAGMSGVSHGNDESPEGVMVIARSAEGEEVEEEKDPRYEANTTPDEHVMPVQTQTKGGDGDVAGREKKMTPHGYNFSDNPRAMKESMSLKLIKEYEGIKVKK